MFSTQNRNVHVTVNGIMRTCVSRGVRVRVGGMCVRVCVCVCVCVWGGGVTNGYNSGGGDHGIWLLLCFEILNQLQTELCCGANKTDAPSRTICNCTYV